MKVLKHLLQHVDVIQVIGDDDMKIRAISFSSGAVQQNDVFVAQRGSVVDGHKYIDDAIKKGALVIVCEILPEIVLDHIVYVQVGDSSQALAILAANYYENPSRKLKLVGVTGTNGKTTIATLLYNLYRDAGFKVGLLSTIKIMVDSASYDTSHTTPDSLTINKYLSLMVEKGCEYCFMEVSSHGIHQKRTVGLTFEGGVFTNLTHDHLDYHNTFKEYRDTKKIFFDQLPKSAFSLVNADDKNGLFMLQNTKSKKYTYALKTLADYKGKILESSFSGMLLTMNRHEIWSKLIGQFNGYNLLAIFGVTQLLGMEELEGLKLISNLDSVSGRFQHEVSASGITVIVDYAHTPDALKNVLQTIAAIRTGKENVLTVVGCGGDRDKSKRPKMGAIAARLSDQVIFTSDNPRTEDPSVIIEEIEAGVEGQDVNKTLVIADRKQAIKAACKMAVKGDIILIAGKGHENYQDINGVKSHFDDFETVTELLNQLEK
ncbi:MAG: UDP-N-acetylmuramoyl-L-alanyl-D-glutamate--2,6-diaminopimelate ligase [Flavobacteriaceae bacterium]|nr:MAG: UDP-N-acetylmuramoyl-L-alanyl-D-glutamate--2,6-diaminopimelate ligase [Flavobacteriaceae bacterium]